MPAPGPALLPAPRLDVAVVGAGVGSLAAATELAAAGLRVAVFEQDQVVGGTAHVFRRGGVTFPAGPLSFTVPGRVVGHLRSLGVERPFLFRRDIFQVKRPGLDVVISVPLGRLAAQLASAFPDERAGIDAVVAVLEEVVAAVRALRVDELVVTPWSLTPGSAEPPSSASSPTAARTVMERWAGVPARVLVERHLRDRRLRDLLGGQGTSGASMSVVLLAQMWDFMAEEGIWYPSAGIAAVPELLGERLRETGGELHLGARVARMLVEGGRVRGVVLADGAEVRAEWVVCGADYRRTVVGLLPDGSIAPAVRRGIVDLPLTESAFTVFLGVEAGRVDLSVFRGQQLLVRPEEGVPVPWVDRPSDRSAFLRDEIWLSHWSAHDPALAPPGMEALVIKVIAPFDAFASFSDQEGHRSPAYHEVKGRLVDRLLAASDRVLPGLASAVRVLDAATPLTYRDRGHRSRGAVAGWSWRADALPEPYARSLVVTPLPGLLAVGILAFTRLFHGGLGTSLTSGRWAAEVVLGRRDAMPDTDWLVSVRR